MWCPPVEFTENELLIRLFHWLFYWVGTFELSDVYIKIEDDEVYVRVFSMNNGDFP